MVFFGTPELRRSGERAAAAEKLAEWQETIFLLSRQLKALRLPTELIGSQQNVMHQMGEGYEVDEPTPNRWNPESIGASKDFDQVEMENVVSNFTSGC